MIWRKSISAILLGILCAALPMRAAGASYIHAIDVSVWQGVIDYQAVRAAGIEAVYIRAGEGSDITDEAFERNYAGFYGQGIPIGFYHFVTAKSEEEAITQAEFFASLVEGKAYSLRLVVEYGVAEEVSRDTANAVLRRFILRLKELTGRDVAIYTDAYGARSVWMQDMAQYPLWIADYAADEPERLGPWTQWAGWQYTDRGSIAGIEGNVDKDYFTDAMMDSALITPEPIGTPKPTATIEPTPEMTKAPEPTVTPAPCATPSYEVITYTIQRGDTLSRIAERYRTSVRAIASLNHIANVDRIYAGETLKIAPGKSAGEIVYSGYRYVVQRGDTLVRIAKRFGTTARVLANYNAIVDMRLIRVGEEIRIPTQEERENGQN